MIRRLAEKTSEKRTRVIRARYAGAIRKRHRDNLTKTRRATESPPHQDNQAAERTANQTIRLPPQDSDFGRDNAPTEAASAHATRTRAQRANRRTERSDYRRRNRISEGITHRSTPHPRTTSEPPNQTIRLPPQDSDFGRPNARTHCREHLNEEDTRRRAVARAFGQEETRLPDDTRTGASIRKKRQGYPTTRSGASIRHLDEKRQGYPTTRTGASIRTKRIPDDAQWREPSEDKITRRRAHWRWYSEESTRRRAVA